MKYTPMKMGVHIKCQSVKKSLKFYLALGFEPVFAYGSKEFLKQFSFPTAPEKYQGVSFAVGNATFEIADGHSAVKQSVFEEKIESSKVSAFFDVESIDAIVAVCKEQEIAIAVIPRVFHWGTKEVVIKDPDGFVLVFREVLPNYGSV